VLEFRNRGGTAVTPSNFFQEDTLRKLLAPTAAILVLCLAFASARAADGALGVGDPAPALSVGKWVKGEPVEKLEKGKIYVVEFWATWCGPCRATIPHMSKLQEQYKDIIFIGQNCWEEDTSGVPAFITQMGDKMTYRVALDDTAHEKKGAMAVNWMTAAGQNGIPTAFVVGKDLKIAWIGHPMQLDNVLKGVVAGTFDAKKLAADQAARDNVMKSIGAAVAAKEYDKALAGVEELAKLQPEMADRLAGATFEILLMKEDYPAAWAQGKKLTELFKDNAPALNNLAWIIVDPSGPVKKPDLALAESAATRATELTKGENASFLDTLARVYFAQGHVDKAIETETKALAKATEPEKPQMNKALETYKGAKK
jgi:thiol-disulfide isomerase/thioredoxin